MSSKIGVILSRTPNMLTLRSYYGIIIFLYVPFIGPLNENTCKLLQGSYCLNAVSKSQSFIIFFHDVLSNWEYSNLNKLTYIHPDVTQNMNSKIGCNKYDFPGCLCYLTKYNYFGFNK